MSNGFLYIATGEKYIKEAEQSARSLLKINPDVNISLITDLDYTSTVFKQVIVNSIPHQDKNWKNGLLYKIDGFAKSPYNNTIFIDSDTYFCEDISPSFELLNYFDILICKDYHDKEEIYINNQKIKGYFPYNTGVVGFTQNSHTKLFIDNWYLNFNNDIEKMWSDQPAFILALATNHVKLHCLDSTYNFRFLNNVAFPDQEKVKIIHGRCSIKDFRLIEKKVNHNLSQRVWVASRRKCYSWTEKNLIRSLITKIYSKLLKIIQ